MTQEHYPPNSSASQSVAKYIPPGYHLAGDLFEDFEALPVWRWLLSANLWALVPMIGAVLCLWLPYRFYIALGAPYAALPQIAWGDAARAALTISLMLATIPIHEGLHALTLRLLGYPARLLWGRGYFYATTTGILTRRHYVRMALTPILVMTTAGGLLLPLVPVAVGEALVLALLLNSAASIGDLFVVTRLLRQPPAALFADDGGIKIYLPKP